MEGTAAREAPQITQFGGDQRPGDRADARDSFDRVFHAREKPLDVEIEFGEPMGAPAPHWRMTFDEEDSKGGSASDCLDSPSGLSVTGEHDHHSNEVKERRRHEQDPA